MRDKITVEQVLCLAHDIISEPRRWCRHAEARFKNYVVEVSPESEGAYSFCSLGALKRATYELNATPSVLEEAVERLAREIDPQTYDVYHTIASFNDGSRSKKPVIKKFCDTIKQVRRDGGLVRAEAE